MADFLLELRSEEIPARMQTKARADLARLFKEHVVSQLGVNLPDVGPMIGIRTYATPRRLVLIADGLPEQTVSVSEETKGPRTSAPPRALEGFLRKTGLRQDQLVDRGGVWFAVQEKPGRKTAHVLAEAIPAIVRAFPWPKSMRWGAASASTESLRWVRPLQGIVALLGEEVVPFEIAGVASGATTLGHRFHHAGAITIGSAADYVETLRGAHVIVDQDERAAIIREGAARLAADAGLELIEDEGLVAENAGLTEWPVPLLGRFDAAYLGVPPEVIQLTARVNQKYFVCRGKDGKLANAFVCTANIAAVDGGAKIVDGNRKVLAARLSDAKFFYETDLKVPLDEQAEKLGQIVFHEKLGTVADKVERVAKLARWLVEEGVVKGADPDMAERAARLAKADLVTGMVGEFPELQGLMGGYYAAAQGEDPTVAAAIRDHYKPVGQGDDVPTAPVTVAVSLADKLDTLVSFFAIGLPPSGSRDPFALRRSALSVIATLLHSKIRLPLSRIFRSDYFTNYMNMLSGPQDRVKTIQRDIEAFERADLTNSVDFERVVDAIAFGDNFKAQAQSLVTSAFTLLDFFADRLKAQQREAGVRHDLIDAVFALGGEDDLVRLLARVHALQAFVGTEDGANLLAGYKRAANILKKEGYEAAAPLHPADAEFALSYTPEKAEARLIAAVESAAPAADEAVAAEDFEAAMAALATLRAPIDAFFEDVTVNDADEDKRAARLALLARVRVAVHGVADFSKIEG